MALTLVALATVANAQTQVCSGMLPMWVSPASPSGFGTGCGYFYLLRVVGTAGAEGYYGLATLPTCNAGICSGLTGNTAVRCWFANGYDCCIETGQALPLSSPTLVGAGLQARWDNDTDQRDGICFAMYTGNGQRLFTVPVVSFNNGQPVTVTGFAVAFLKGRPGNTSSSGVFVEFQPTGVVDVNTSTWGRIRTRYR